MSKQITITLIRKEFPELLVEESCKKIIEEGVLFSLPECLLHYIDEHKNYFPDCLTLAVETILVNEFVGDSDESSYETESETEPEPEPQPKDEIPSDSSESMEQKIDENELV